MNNISAIQSLLQQHSDPILVGRKALFFKTGPGEYGQHDKFLGITVPVLHKLAKQFSHVSLQEIGLLVGSRYNEERLLAFFILVMHYKKADKSTRHQLYLFYVDNMKQVNNWNLVDSSAHLIVGAYLYEYGHNKDVLIKMAQSNDLWERRVAIVATWYFIKKLDFTWTLTMANILLHDKHDLIHKAVGWMLREVGNKNIDQLKTFLDEHAAIMPRTMLRYAIEKFPPEERLFYLTRKAKQ